MRVEINGREYRFEVNGTVGLGYKAEQVLGEELDPTNKMHVAALCYAALFYSNNGQVMSWYEFISTLTSEVNNQMVNHLTERWAVLEGRMVENAPKESTAGE